MKNIKKIPISKSNKISSFQNLKIKKKISKRRKFKTNRIIKKTLINKLFKPKRKIDNNILSLKNLDQVNFNFENTLKKNGDDISEIICKSIKSRKSSICDNVSIHYDSWNCDILAMRTPVKSSKNY